MASAARARAGKYSKPKRGGGKNFSRASMATDENGDVISMWAEQSQSARRKKDPLPENDSLSESEDEEDDNDDGSDSDSSDSESDQESASLETNPSSSVVDSSAGIQSFFGADNAKLGNVEMTREEKKAAARSRKAQAIARTQARPQPGDLPPNSSDEDESTQPISIPAGSKSRIGGSGILAKKFEPGKNQAQKSSSSQSGGSKDVADSKTQSDNEDAVTEARVELERLRLVRERRIADAARHKVELEEKAEQERSKKEQLERESRRRELAASRGTKRGGKK